MTVNEFVIPSIYFTRFYHRPFPQYFSSMEYTQKNKPDKNKSKCYVPEFIKGLK